jgi:hypothetical protein
MNPTSDKTFECAYCHVIVSKANRARHLRTCNPEEYRVELKEKEESK